MNHPFNPQPTEPGLCADCKRPMIDHTDRATCEVCGTSGEMILTSSRILMCMECDYKDIRVRTPAELQNRSVEVRRRWHEVDAAIKISTDIFNAKTIAIHEVKKAIDEDPSVPTDQKHFTLAKLLETRYDKLLQVIFEANQTKVEAENEQRAIQTFYNDLGKKLRADEREKIRLKDATYKPIEKVVVDKTPKAPKIKKVDLNEVRTACLKAGIPDAVSVIMVLCTAKKTTDIDEVILSYKRAKENMKKEG